MKEPKITRTVTIEDWTLSLWSDEEPRVRDLDLAERLGYERPRNIRKLIERRLEDSEFGEVRSTVEHVENQTFSTVEQVEKKTSVVDEGSPGQTGPKFHNRQYGKEYYLTEAQALEIAATSETPNGKTILRALIKVFLLAKQGKLPGQGQANPQSAEPLFAAVVAAMGKRASEGHVEAAKVYLKLVERDEPKKSPVTSEPAPPKEATMRKKIEALDREHPRLGYTEIARRLGTTRGYISRVLRRMTPPQS